MCGFLSLLTWHLLYGTYNISIFRGSEVNSKRFERTEDKVRLATKSMISKNQWKDLAIDKLTGKMLPMFDNQNVREIIMHNQFGTKPGQLKNSQASKNDMSPTSTSQSVRPVISINNVNEMTSQKAGSAMALSRQVNGHFSQAVSGNRSLLQTTSPLNGELKKNEHILENVWNMYKERTDKMNAKLTNENDSKQNRNFTSVERNFKTPVLNHTSSDHRNTSYLHNAEKILQNDKAEILQKDNTEILQNDNPNLSLAGPKEVITQVTKKAAVNKTSVLNYLNRSEIISLYYGHSVINSSRLQQLRKHHPWLVLSNFEQLDPKTTFRPDICQNCFKPDFPIIIDQKMRCKTWNSGKLDLLILIFSAPSNVNTRDVIRKTWGKLCRNPGQPTACLFVIGLSRNKTTNKRLHIENALYMDILQIGFRDSYSNLTYKTISSLKWVADNCYKLKHVMKTDDDMYVNTMLIPLMLQAAPTKRFMGGHCWGPSRPSRDSFSKWYVPLTSFKRDKLPPMCSGTGYIISMDVVKSIVFTSQNIPFFHLEDVYIAMCVQQLGILPVSIVGFSNMFQEFDACRYRNEVMTSHQISSGYLNLYWQDIQQCPPIQVSPQELYIPLSFSDIE
ncbi:uncharacterized protein LOC121373215 [Gigantopelta aegis]|uniref:uncharacterized protein LOC121373215 n=1 Tax=Gigantopelta aegis TaxID=1735272 RepID=UPI001B88E63A|nr:uncharacterized protein LOC121373215 [Gigantopelta aegis]